MTVEFELWDMETGNFLEKFSSEAELRHALQEYAQLEGEAYLDQLTVRPIRETGGVREWLPAIVGRDLVVATAKSPRSDFDVQVYVSCHAQGNLVSRLADDLEMYRGIGASHGVARSQMIPSRGDEFRAAPDLLMAS